MSNWKAWPENWPVYKQECFGSWRKRCDMLVGPCACGAWHQDDEFQLTTAGGLLRYGLPVVSRPLLDLTKDEL